MLNSLQKKKPYHLLYINCVCICLFHFGPFGLNTFNLMFFLAALHLIWHRSQSVKMEILFYLLYYIKYNRKCCWLAVTPFNMYKTIHFLFFLLLE